MKSIKFFAITMLAALSLFWSNAAFAVEIALNNGGKAIIDIESLEKNWELRISDQSDEGMIRVWIPEGRSISPTCESIIFSAMVLESHEPMEKTISSLQDLDDDSYTVIEQSEDEAVLSFTDLEFGGSGVVRIWNLPGVQYSAVYRNENLNDEDQVKWIAFLKNGIQIQ